MFSLHQGREAERKKRRDAKANPALRKKLRKDLGIPNLNPFKAQILQRVSPASYADSASGISTARRARAATDI